MKLSIVIPTLNEASTIAATLAAMQPLRRRGIEIIVADGGSTDGSAELAKPLADKFFITGRGRARQTSLGAARAQGDILLFLHADTALPGDADTVIVSALSTGKRV